MELQGSICRLRPLEVSDRDRLVELLDDRRIWRNLSDRVPSPYTAEDAMSFLEPSFLEPSFLEPSFLEPSFLESRDEEAEITFGIETADGLVGAIGIHPLDGEHRGVGRVGYWLTPAVWGRGIATDALTAIVRYGRAELGLHRLQASVYGWNPASARVLEKCGFAHEGTLRRNIRKGDDVTDELIYGRLLTQAP